MKTADIRQIDDYQWRIEPQGAMRVPAVIFASERLLREMDEKVREQICNVAALPGILSAAYAMPDAHWGYGFPIGGVAAFDPDKGGVVSAGGVGFDISCGVRTLRTGIKAQDLAGKESELADILFATIPAGVGSTGRLSLNKQEMHAMLEGGARWAVERGFGVAEDLQFTEEQGCMAGAKPEYVSAQAIKRQHKEMGTLGSGNHYLEVQRVTSIYDAAIAGVYGIAQDDILISIHCGSRGLGHQIGTDYLATMAMSASGHGISLPDRELACAPINSEQGQHYLGAMRAAINCALANRQILTHLAREAWDRLFPKGTISVLYDVSHNTCKVERHTIGKREQAVFIHRKGATRSFGPGHPELPAAYRKAGQPVLIGGTMGTASHILAGTKEAEQRCFSSACHGAGRSMSRHQAKKTWQGRQLLDQLAHQGIIIRSPSLRGVAEEAPGAYKDVEEVIDSAHNSGLAHKVARLEPVVCIKG